jgi:hypothetical protein
VSTFRDMQLGQLVEDNLASHGALVLRLNRMFLDHLKSTWAPKTLRMISSEQCKLAYRNALLGMPPAHEPDTPPHVKQAIAQASILPSAALALLASKAREQCFVLALSPQRCLEARLPRLLPTSWHSCLKAAPFLGSLASRVPRPVSWFSCFKAALSWLSCLKGLPQRQAFSQRCLGSLSTPL